MRKSNRRHRADYHTKHQTNTFLWVLFLAACLFVVGVLVTISLTTQSSQTAGTIGPQSIFSKVASSPPPPPDLPQ